MIKKKGFITLLVIMLSMLLMLSGCAKETQQSKKNMEPKAITTQSPTDISKQTKNSNEPKVPIIKKIGQSKVITNYYYSPDGKHYFVEKKYKMDDSEMGPYNMSDIFYNNESTSIGNEYSLFPRNSRESVKPIIWLNNEEALFTKNYDNPDVQFGVYNSKTNNSKDFSLPDYSWGYYNANITKNKIVFMLNLNKIGVYNYDIKANTWQKLYSYEIPSYGYNFNINSFLGMDNNVYFDQVSDSKGVKKDQLTREIKIYNLNTKKVETFKANAKILNMSPNRKHLTYLDYKNNKTMIFDLVQHSTIDIPITTELSWNQSSDEYAYISSDEDNVVVNKIGKGKKSQSKIFIGNLKKEKYKAMNLQYRGNNLLFYLVKYTGPNELIDDVISYSIER